jgi:hypothetical protein
MFCGIGDEIPFSYFGISVMFIVFAIVLVITEAIFQNFEAQNTIW